MYEESDARWREQEAREKAKRRWIEAAAVIAAVAFLLALIRPALLLAVPDEPPILFGEPRDAG